MIVPSIDISGGRAVQLRQGRELVLTSERDPLALATEFNRYGEIAVIDLDAATGSGHNRELIQKICQRADVRVGGGIRDVECGNQYLKAGAKSLIIGTNANAEFLSAFPRERVMVALDHIGGEVVDHGWQHFTGDSIWQRAERLDPFCSSYLVTFVEAEGGMGGMSVAAVREALARLQKPLTVAGGIATTGEVVSVSRSGADVQVGMALYTGAVDPVEAVIGSIDFDSSGLVPTIVQDQQGQNLMMAYSSAESLRLALKDGRGVYFSRSRQEIWEKGRTSGHKQILLSCRVDCDWDCLLFIVDQEQTACHRNSYSCFGQASANRRFNLSQLFQLLKQRKQALPEHSYSATLFKDRRKLMKKLMEESFEVASFDSRDNLRWEIADLLYFTSVLAVDEGLEWAEIEAELGGRFK